MQHTSLLCSLIIISGWYVFLLYIIIELSLEPETNLPSFKIHKQFTPEVWFVNLWIGFFISTYSLVIILPKFWILFIILFICSSSIL